MPAISRSPPWFVHAQSKTTVFVSGRFSRAVIVAVRVSPRPTGRRKLRS
jgi:hypothetical protein